MDRFTCKCCGECRFTRFIDGSFCCDNPESENFGCDTSYDDSCEEFEEKD